MYGDVHVVTGYGQILNQENIKPGIDLKELEKRMISGGYIKKPVRDPQEKLNEELKAEAQKLGISFGEFAKKTPTPKKLMDHPKVQEELREMRPPTPPKRSGTPRYELKYERPTSPLPSMTIDTEYREEEEEAEYEEEADEYEPEDYEPDDYSPKYETEYKDYHEPSGGRTQEQQRREHIDSIIGNDGFSFEKEKREDLKCSMLAEIDDLMTSLAEEDVDLSRIPKVNQRTPFAEVESVLKMLRHKNDHARYCSFAEEFLMFGAYALEEVFDGKRTWLGRYSPDLTGWHNHVNVKLRRMRHDTGQLVSGVMNDYNIGPGARLLLELVPNMVLYSKLKKQQHAQPGLFTNDEMNQATQNIRNVTED